MAGIVMARRGLAGCVALMALALLPVGAATVPALRGPVVLTVTGLDPATHPGGTVLFDMAMLQALGQADVLTSSIWTTGRHVYTGVPVRALADYLGLGSATLMLHALNDYAVDLPLSETEPAAPILAYAMDGQPMPVRDKGPLWVIYPYDAGSQYRTDTTFSRSVWQLDRIDVVR